MNTYPAVRDPGSIELLFRNIRSSVPPEKVTTDYLTDAGFRRQTDVKLLELLFFLGFIDSSLSPSELWRRSSGTDETVFSAILAEALSSAYSRVFQTYPGGSGADGKALMAFFRDQTGVSDTEAAYMVLTMQVLGDIANFRGAGETPKEKPEPAVPAPDEKQSEGKHPLPDVPDEPAPTIEVPREGLSLNISIPPEAMDREMTDILKALLRKLL